jgi:hypothetical protein
MKTRLDNTIDELELIALSQTRFKEVRPGTLYIGPGQETSRLVNSLNEGQCIVIERALLFDEHPSYGDTLAGVPRFLQNCIGSRYGTVSIRRNERGQFIVCRHPEGDRISDAEWDRLMRGLV